MSEVGLVDYVLENFIYGIGEFVFYAMPHFAAEIISKVDSPYQGLTYIRYNSILVIPPNMPVHANGGNYFLRIFRLFAYNRFVVVKKS